MGAPGVEGRRRFVWDQLIKLIPQRPELINCGGGDRDSDDAMRRYSRNGGDAMSRNGGNQNGGDARRGGGVVCVCASVVWRRRWWLGAGGWGEVGFNSRILGRLEVEVGQDVNIGLRPAIFKACLEEGCIHWAPNFLRAGLLHLYHFERHFFFVSKTPLKKNNTRTPQVNNEWQGKPLPRAPSNANLTMENCRDGSGVEEGGTTLFRCRSCGRCGVWVVGGVEETVGSASSRRWQRASVWCGSAGE
jgi:hypothetical protein